MQDYALFQSNDGLFDLEVDAETKLFKKIDGFETCISLQIFTDKRSTKDDVSDPLNRKGWIGDVLTKKDKYEIGSYLYLKDQSRDTQLDRNEVKAFIKDAMNYFISVGILTRVVINMIGNLVEIILYKNENMLDKFNEIWKDTKNV